MSQLFQDFGTVNKGGNKYCLATVSYDNPDSSYTFSIARSRYYLGTLGLDHAYFLLTGNCHVDDARNVVIKEFLESDCTHLIFIDADVSWRPYDLHDLIKYDVDVVGGVYPFRRRGGTTAGEMPVRMKLDNFTPDSGGLLEVDGLPSGFMKIKREVLEKLEESSNKFWNKLDRNRKVPIIFERGYEDGIRWGGDINFCNKARDAGFKIFADYEMTLGHTGKEIIKSSLGRALRHRNKETIRFVVDKVIEGRETLDDLTEVIHSIGNPYSALEDSLALCIATARANTENLPVIETGSGLSTILMAAANPRAMVYAIEHDKRYCEELRALVRETGVGNIALCYAPIKDGWYDKAELDNLPDHFALGFNDGPPRYLGSRKWFFDYFQDRIDVIVADDTEDPSYRLWVSEWCQENNRTVDFVERSSIIKRKDG